VQPSVNIAGASSNTRGAFGAASFGLTTTFALGRRLINMRGLRAGLALSLWTPFLIALAKGQSPAVFKQLLEELAAFLAVVVSTSFRLPRQGQVWTWALTAQGTDCSVRHLGYVETTNRSGLPVRGTCLPVPVGPADMTHEELTVPQDIVSLWQKYRRLTGDVRWQFLRAASKSQEARLLWDEQRGTASFALMVVACEALKPADPLYSEHNIYDVIDALLGKGARERLQTQLFDPKIHSSFIRNPFAVRTSIAASFTAPSLRMKS